MPMAKLSVIVPTKNRPAEVRRTVESLVGQSRLPDELIIVDQSDAPVQLDCLPFALQHIHNPHLMGLTAARNAAMRVAHGDVWLFLDDDVVLEPNFIEELLAAYTPDVTGVSGIITNYSSPSLARRLR